MSYNDLSGKKMNVPRGTARRKRRNLAKSVLEGKGFAIY